MAAGSRKLAREMLFTALYQADILKNEALDRILPILNLDLLEGEERVLSSGDKAFVVEYAKGIFDNKKVIIDSLHTHMKDWSIERIGAVERVVLFIAVYELLFEEKLAHTIVINEAIELAKIYGDDATSKFINGILAKYVN